MLLYFQRLITFSSSLAAVDINTADSVTESVNQGPKVEIAVGIGEIVSAAGGSIPQRETGSTAAVGDPELGSGDLSNINTLVGGVGLVEHDGSGIVVGHNGDRDGRADSEGKRAEDCGFEHHLDTIVGRKSDFFLSVKDELMSKETLISTEL